jgi:hypothetical protein
VCRPRGNEAAAGVIPMSDGEHPDFAVSKDVNPVSRELTALAELLGIDRDMEVV